MTKHSAKEIVRLSRDEPNFFAVPYQVLITNTCTALIDAGKPITKENTHIVLTGFAISTILDYINSKDLEKETDTILTDTLVKEVSGLMWETWLKLNVEKYAERIKGDNVVPLKAVN